MVNQAKDYFSSIIFLPNLQHLFLRRSTGCCARDGRAVDCGGLVRRILWKNRWPKRSEGSNLKSFWLSYFVYILKSVSSNSYYFGHCENLIIRLKRHNQGKVRSTKNKRPWLLHYSEEFSTKSEAFQREIFFKSFEGRQWLIRQRIISPR